MELLEDITSYERDCSLIKEAEKMVASEKKKSEKQAGENLRKAAMERLASMYKDELLIVLTTIFDRKETF